MFTKALSFAFLAAVNMVSAVDMPTISAVGAKFFFSNGTQYYIKGKPSISQFFSSLPNNVSRHCLPAYLPRPSHQRHSVHARRCLDGRPGGQYYTRLSCRLDRRSRCVHECLCVLRNLSLPRFGHLRHPVQPGESSALANALGCC